MHSCICCWCCYDADAVSQAGVKTLLIDNGFCTFFNNGNPVFSKGPRSLPRNPSDRTILGKWFFNHYILVDKLLAKGLWSFETCLSASDNSFGKLVSSLESPITFGNRFIEVSLIPLFIAGFNLLSCKLDNFAFTLLQ